VQQITPQRVAELLAGPGELALLDVREQGVHYRGHPFFACSAPLSRLELVIGDLVPRRTAPVVLLDDGKEGLAEQAENKLKELHYSDVSVMSGGTGGWKAAGYELFSGVNVPSKAFGEFVEHHYATPRIAPGELKRLQEIKKVLVVDSRPFEEYHRMNIPGGIDVPGAELVYRIHDLAPSPDTLIVVNCAGRTRSIIGCQSLRNAGIQNPVVALKDGTMGWELAGYECERGASRVAPPPSGEGRDKAHAAAERVAQRLMESRFTLDDFRTQLAQVKKMGPIGQLLGMIPGAGQLAGAAQEAVDDGHLKRIEAIIDSMTPAERHHPELIKASRRRRIATGSGTTPADVNRLLKQFGEMQRLMRQFGSGRLPRGGNGLRSILGG